MRDPRLGIRSILPLLTCCVGWLVTGGTVWAQEASSAALGLGSHMFRHVLHERGCKPVTDFDGIAVDAEHSLLILLGDLTMLEELDRRNFSNARRRARYPNAGSTLDGFVRDGGSILVASDRTDASNRFALLGFSFDGNKLHVQAEQGYKQSEEMAFVEPTQAGQFLLRGLDRVATNRPGSLLHFRPTLTPLALFKGRCWREGDERQFQRLDRPCFALGGQILQGRLMALSDHSVFINAMLWQEDNDNYEFTQRLVDWLTESGKRKTVLFVEDGFVQNDFDIPMQQLPMAPLPSPERIVQAINEGLFGLEEEDRFNGLVSQMTGGNNPVRYLHTLVLFLTGLFLVYGLSRLSLARYRSEAGGVRYEDSIADALPDTDVTTQRQRVLRQSGNYRELARSQARLVIEQCFAAPVEVREGWRKLAAGLPDTGSWMERWHRRRLVRRLWSLAYQEPPARITARDWRRLAQEWETLPGFTKPEAAR